MISVAKVHGERRVNIGGEQSRGSVIRGFISDAGEFALYLINNGKFGGF